MSVMRLSIDTKSLYYNIKNDNQTGHTATVATPLKQGSAVRPELSMLTQIPESIHPASREQLICQILSNSRADAKINGVFVFDKVAVNGHLLENLPAYCMYIREETNSANVHFGRQKLHYPLSLSFEDLDTCIDNKAVISSISKYINDYAFIVEAFEYETEERVLNFDVTIAGTNQVPYSKVFVNRRGVGNKFSTLLADEPDSYDTEIIALRQKLGYDKVFPDNYNDIVANNYSQAREIVAEHLSSIGAMNIRLLRNEYPFSLFDIEYRISGQKRFAIVQQTATKERSFILSTERIQFINDFPEETFLFLVTDICGEKEIDEYSAFDINALQKSIASIRFEDRR